MRVEVREAPFAPYDELMQYQAQIKVGSFGACASFVGTMRDFNLDDDVDSMQLEHYAQMTQYQLEKIVAEHVEQCQLHDALVVHRIGTIYPGNPIVLVATWSAHRAAAFDACRGIMEALKSKATFWKKEHLPNQQSRWVKPV